MVSASPPARPPAPMIPLRTYGAEKSKAKSMVSKIERLELTLPNERSSTLTTMHGVNPTPFPTFALRLAAFRG